MRREPFRICVKALDASLRFFGSGDGGNTGITLKSR